VGRLLVIDDDEFHLLVSRRALEEAGHDVSTASSGEVGLQVAIHDGQGFDCVLLDEDMPGLSGTQVVRELRGHERYGLTPVSIVSSRPGHWLRRHSRQAGATSWMQKHPDPGVLVRHVASLLAKS
jgi:two-component system, chemotaxis family, chemotaxis protein CheY